MIFLLFIVIDNLIYVSGKIEILISPSSNKFIIISVSSYENVNKQCQYINYYKILCLNRISITFSFGCTMSLTLLICKW
jgi:competence transcription factor ComK